MSNKNKITVARLSAKLEYLRIALADAYATEFAHSEDDSKIDIEALWDDCEAEIDRNMDDIMAERKKNGAKRRVKSDSDARTCPHVFEKAKGQKKGTICNKPCLEGSDHCKQHTKKDGEVHTCQYPFGERSKHAGELCGARVQKFAAPFQKEGSHYHGQYFCSQHFEAMIKRENNVRTQCTHTNGPNSKNPGERCTTFTKGDKCARHSKKKTKEVKSDEEKEEVKSEEEKEELEVKSEEEIEEEPVKAAPAKAAKAAKAAPKETAPSKQKGTRRIRPTKSEDK